MKNFLSYIRSLFEGSSVNSGKKSDKFPFDDHPDTYTITCSHILDNGEPILYVSHDGDDGMWQFLCGKTHTESEARVVSLGEVFAKDNTLADIADMPPGYIAERSDVHDGWQIKKRG